MFVEVSVPVRNGLGKQFIDQGDHRYEEYIQRIIIFCKILLDLVRIKVLVYNRGLWWHFVLILTVVTWSWMLYEIDSWAHLVVGGDDRWSVASSAGSAFGWYAIQPHFIKCCHLLFNLVRLIKLFVVSIWQVMNPEKWKYIYQWWYQKIGLWSPGISEPCAR